MSEIERIQALTDNTESLINDYKEGLITEQEVYERLITDTLSLLEVANND